MKSPASCQVPGLTKLLEKHLGDLETGRYVEVGAFDGMNWSNTHLLAKSGWTGIAIEPNPFHFGKLESNLRDLDVTCIQLAIGDHSGEGELYLAGSLSTLDDEQVEVYRKVGWSKYLFPDNLPTYTVRIRTLDYILEKHKWEPDFELISIDVEGAELDVLRGFDLDRWRPKLMIIETYEMSPTRSLARNAEKIGKILDLYGYRSVQADTINTVYVRDV